MNINDLYQFEITTQIRFYQPIRLNVFVVKQIARFRFPIHIIKIHEYLHRFGLQTVIDETDKTDETQANMYWTHFVGFADEDKPLSE